jgi:hypothetical protein
MHLLIFISVLALCWLVYSLLRTQKRMEAELREIRKKCVTSGFVQEPEPSITTSKITEGLQKLMALTT